MWQQLLDGRSRSDALTFVELILSQIAKRESHTWPPTLANGRAGSVLLHVYAERAGIRVSDNKALAAADLQAVVEALSTQPLPPTHLGGCIGLGWLLQHCESSFSIDVGVSLSELDAALNARLAAGQWNSGFDFEQGLVGVIPYAVEREDSLLQDLIVLRLAESAIAQEAGIVWRTGQDVSSRELSESSSIGHIDLGIAHGVAGVLGGLVSLHATTQLERRLELIVGATSWLLSRRQRDGRPSIFPDIDIGDGHARFCFSGWCYGAAGICVVLARCRRLLPLVLHDDVIDAVRQLALEQPERYSIDDGSVCHGEAGLVLMFLRLAELTSIAECWSAASFWTERLLSRLEIGLHNLRFQKSGTWTEVGGLLNGTVGIALALLAACEKSPPSWDRCLLLS